MRPISIVKRARALPRGSWLVRTMPRATMVILLRGCDALSNRATVGRFISSTRYKSMWSCLRCVCRLLFRIRMSWKQKWDAMGFLAFIDANQLLVAIDVLNLDVFVADRLKLYVILIKDLDLQQTSLNCRVPISSL